MAATDARRRKRAALMLILTTGTFAGLPVQAADTAKGAQLAKRWCANCHLVDDHARKTLQQGPPSFRSVARSGISAGQLRVFLSHPHGAMPDLSLSRAEIDDLIAYLLTLR
jgi:cytochrome c